MTAHVCTRTRVASAADWVRFTIADAATYQRGIAIARAMHWTRWGNAEGVALPMRIAMAFAMTLMNAWARSMPAAFATGRELFTIVVALRCQQAIAIAMATPWMPLENAEDRAPKMRTAMVFAMTSTRALEALTRWACATVHASADADNDGICDDVDDCIGVVDACGICNGPGAVYECGCADIPAGDCDCNGNTLDVLGECGGTCTADADADGICDDVDPCVGQYDECGICNGSGAVAGYDCDGDCLADFDGDGVCDEFEVEGCTYEEACNYDSDATDDDGSCTYAMPGLDCAGSCLFDEDNDGVCDQNEITGCQDESACNYESTATEAGYCDYAVPGQDCDGACLNDADGDGICDEDEAAMQAAIDSAMETILSALAGGNYCGDGTVWMEETSECVPLDACFGDLDNNGNRGTEDLLLFLSVYGEACL